MPVASQTILMADDGDAVKRDFMAKFRPLFDKADLRAVGHDVLVAVYSRAGRKTAGGIIVTDTNREDDFQGKVGLVLSLGAMCCDEHTDGLWSAWFGGRPPQIGDWVTMKPSDASAMVIQDQTFRTLEWKYIRLCVGRPDLVM